MDVDMDGQWRRQKANIIQWTFPQMDGSWERTWHGLPARRRMIPVSLCRHTLDGVTSPERELEEEEVPLRVLGGGGNWKMCGSTGSSRKGSWWLVMKRNTTHCLEKKPSVTSLWFLKNSSETCSWTCRGMPDQQEVTPPNRNQSKDAQKARMKEAQFSEPQFTAATTSWAHVHLWCRPALPHIWTRFRCCYRNNFWNEAVGSFGPDPSKLKAEQLKTASCCQLSLHNTNNRF